ncbi:MAG: response regulator [Lachnospiraceae bacterium]|nr:response regulator [Lachnospiraceae bacterium]
MNTVEELERLRQENEQLREENLRLQQVIDTSEKRLGDFMRNLNHGIRTPLNASVGLTNLMLQNKLTDEEMLTYIKNIEQSGITVQRILNDLLDYSYLETEVITLEEEEYNIIELFAEIDGELRVRTGGKDIKEYIDLDPDLPSVLYGDKNRLKQIILSVVNNAVRFTLRGAIYFKVRVDIHDDSDRAVLFFSIRDTGLGFDEKTVEHLFDPFVGNEKAFPSSADGTGLELSIARRLVELMSGGIQAHSEKGVGTEIFFTIPQKVVDVTPVEPISTEDDEFHFIAPKAKVLIVDDNEMNLTVAKGHLAPLKMNVDVALNGREAVEMIEREKYDLVFMDHMMPEMDGVEAVRILRKKEDAYFKNLPIIALSANVLEKSKKIFKEEGMNDFLEKPVKPMDIVFATRRWLPKNLIEKTDKPTFEIRTENNLPKIKGIDSQEGVKYSGSKTRWLEMLGDFYHIIDLKSQKIEDDLASGDIASYTIEVHALKNTARLIGAMELSSEFFELEKLGDENAVAILKDKTPPVLRHFSDYKEVLKPYAFAKEEKKRNLVSNEEIVAALTEIRDAIDGFDLDGADAGMEKLNTYTVPEEYKERMKKLRALVADVAMEDVINETTALIKEFSR